MHFVYLFTSHCGYHVASECQPSTHITACEMYSMRGGKAREEVTDLPCGHTNEAHRHMVQPLAENVPARVVFIMVYGTKLQGQQHLNIEPLS